MGLNIGIDLGTTYSVVAYVDNGSAKIIQTSQDSVTTASAVYLEEDGTLTIGQEAKQEQKYHGQVATFYKRNIGSDSKDYDLENGRSYSAVDLSSIFLKELVKRVEEKMHQKVDGAVITVPAYFTDHERSNTRKAAERAGIHVLHMINEPTAAAIAYGLDKSDNKKILVYDLGGGTFDVSVAQITKDAIQIIATMGDHQLGGKDWDIAICKWAAEQFAEEYGEDFSYDKEQMDALMVDAETLKRNLTNKSQADIHVRYNGDRGKYTLTEAEFRKRTRPLVEHTGKLIRDMFAENHLSWNDIDDVILVGGSTRMTMIEDYITELQGKPALRGINADEAVALGAAITADSIAQSIQNFSLDGQVGFEISAGNKTVKDVISHSLGLIAAREENQGDVLYRTFYNEIMIPRNTATQQATMTKQFRLNSNTQDIYLTQWESESLPEESAIIGKYQTMGITPNQLFSVTYFHNPDGTVNITAEQSGKQLRVQKVLECADRTFEPEQAQMPAKGAVVIAIDLSGSMGSIADEDGLTDLANKIDADKPLTDAEIEQAQFYVKFDEMVENQDKLFWEIRTLASKMWYTSIGMAKKAIHGFIDQMPLSTVSFGVIGFAEKNKIFSVISNDERQLRNAVDDIQISPEVGNNNTEQPMDLIYNMLTQYKNQNGLDFGYAVILTDGEWDDDASNAALRAKQKFVSAGFEVIAQGFGEANETFIQKLATRQDLSGVGELSNLSTSMSNIAQVISDGFQA